MIRLLAKKRPSGRRLYLDSNCFLCRAHKKGLTVQFHTMTEGSEKNAASHDEYIGLLNNSSFKPTVEIFTHPENGAGFIGSQCDGAASFVGATFFLPFLYYSKGDSSKRELFMFGRNAVKLNP